VSFRASTVSALPIVATWQDAVQIVRLCMLDRIEEVGAATGRAGAC
jgi:hypothetical protein